MSRALRTSQVMHAAQQADAATLLKALNEEAADAANDDDGGGGGDGAGGGPEEPAGMAAGGGSGKAEGRGVRFGGGRMPGGRVVGLPRDLAKELSERVDVMERENLQVLLPLLVPLGASAPLVRCLYPSPLLVLQLAEWLQRNHRATQEKINLLTEATFAITNMLAGVQVMMPPPLPSHPPSPSPTSGHGTPPPPLG